MILSLSEADRRSWRERRSLPDGSEDLSPNGLFHSAGAADAVILRPRDGEERESRPLPPGQRLERTSLADDGSSLALATRDDRGQARLYRSRAGEAPREVERAFSLHGMDLSPDGQGLAYLSLDQVKLQRDGESTRTLVKLPAMLDEVHYLHDGRLLVEGHASCWSSRPVSTFWLLDGQGQTVFLNDPTAAESLRPGVLEALDEGYRNAFPMADAEQRRQLVNQFGYHTPSYRIPSPDKGRMVFTVRPRLEPGDPRAGLYLVERGQGQARPIRQADGADLLGGRELSSVTWRPDGREAALVLTRGTGDAVACVVGDQADRAQVLPYRLARPETFWSPSGRYLAVQVVVDDMPAIYAFDTEKRNFIPVVTGYQLQGWRGERILAQNGDQAPLELEPASLDPRFAPGQLFGRPLPEEGNDPGVRIEPEHVVVGGVRIPRRG